jgi:hypothetical protein
MIDRMERFVITFGRWVLVVSAVVLLVVGIFGSLGLGLVVLTTSPENVSRPSAGASFAAPKVSPVEEADRLKRLKVAKKQFNSKLEDANEQISITNGNAYNTDDEIRSRFRELFEKPENADDLSKRGRLADNRDAEVAENCLDKTAQHEAVIASIKRDLTQIAKLNNLAESDISFGHERDLRAEFDTPESCDVLSSTVAAVAKILRETYPSDWGFEEVGEVRLKASEGTKDRIGKELEDLLMDLSASTDEEYADEVITRMVGFAEASKDYYLPVIMQLEESNRFTRENVEIVGNSITAQVEGYFGSAYSEWNSYQRSIEGARGNSEDRLVWATGLLASSGVFWAILLSILVLVAFFSMERHQRFLERLRVQEDVDTRPAE